MQLPLPLVRTRCLLFILCFIIQSSFRLSFTFAFLKTCRIRVTNEIIFPQEDKASEAESEGKYSCLLNLAFA